MKLQLTRQIFRLGAFTSDSLTIVHSTTNTTRGPAFKICPKRKLGVMRARLGGFCCLQSTSPGAQDYSISLVPILCFAYLFFVLLCFSQKRLHRPLYSEGPIHLFCAFCFCTE